MPRYQRPYVRFVHGQPRIYTYVRRWTAEDYELIEHLIEEYNLPPAEIRFHFDPIVPSEAMRSAMMRAGITHNRARGRPTKTEQEYWRKIREEFFTPERMAEIDTFLAEERQDRHDTYRERKGVPA